MSSSPASRVRFGWLLRRMLFSVTVLPFVVAGPILAVFAISGEAGNLLYDFKGGLWNAGVAILHGHSPYLAGFLAHQAAIMRAGGIALGETTARPFSIPVYPAAANVAIVPLSLLPAGVAGAIYTVITIAAMVIGIRLLGVRDWRCFLLVAVSWPFLFGLYLGAVGPFLVLGAGVAWRWRERLWPPALAIASIVALKIFPWTLAVWLLVTRRRRAFIAAAVACAVLTFGAWAAIGFHGLLQYPQMLSNMSFLQEGRADSIVTGLLIAGVSPNLASGLAILLALAILGVAWRVRGLPDGDRRAFGLAIIAALTGTPIVWDHYMVLMFVPIAMLSPRVSRLWLGPVLLSNVEIISRMAFPAGGKVVPYPVTALSGVLPWLLLQVVVGFCLCTTAEQRAAWVVGARRRVALPGLPGGTRGSLGRASAAVAAEGGPASS